MCISNYRRRHLGSSGSVGAAGGNGSASATDGLRTYLLLDNRNVQQDGGARIVLGRVTKPASRKPVLTEEEQWEMRFDNMQPNVYYDADAKKWRAWYSTMSKCGGNVTGPGTNPALPPDCQALPSNCSADYNPTWHWRSIPRAGVFAYAESADGVAWTKPNLGKTEWPEGSGDTNNNILFAFGMGSTGGCGTGITLDTTSAPPPPWSPPVPRPPPPVRYAAHHVWRWATCHGAKLGPCRLPGCVLEECCVRHHAMAGCLVSQLFCGTARAVQPLRWPVRSFPVLWVAWCRMVHAD